jgi:hypothetical protein
VHVHARSTNAQTQELVVIGEGTLLVMAVLAVLGVT